MSNELKLMKSEIEKNNKIFLENQKNTIKKSIKTFFNLHQDVQYVIWYQYTPAWNDGDPCYFSFGNLSVAFEEVDIDMGSNLHAEIYDDDHNEKDWYTDEDEDERKKTYSVYNLEDDPDKKQLCDDINSLESILISCDVALEHEFGSNATVLVGRDGEAKHDYYSCGH